MSSGKSESVTEKTFKKWPNHSQFEYDVDDEGKVRNLKCKICSQKWPEIQLEIKRRQLRGSVAESTKSYIDGVNYVHKGNIERHCRPTSLHEFALNLIKQEKKESPSASISVDLPSKTPKIDHVLKTSSKDSYIKLFKTALYIAQEELPYTKLPSLVQLQKSNGASMMESKSSRKNCTTYINYLAEVVRSDVSELLKSSKFISGLCDGSEARKTKEEKELVYAKLVIDGKPVCIFLCCQSMKDFNGTDAAAVLSAYKDGFTKYQIDITGDDKEKFVAACADGASVNMGSKTGAMTMLKNSIPWMIIIHCSLHKLELAIKDSYKSSSNFQQIDDTMNSIYYLFKNSGKNWRLMKLIAEKMQVAIRRFPKVNGTRFQSHKERGLDILMYNLCVFLMFCENAQESRLLTAPMTQKVRGFLKKILEYQFIGSVALYSEVLKKTSHVIFTIETLDSVISDVLDSLDDCAETLEELKNQEKVLPKKEGAFECKDKDGKLVLEATATNLPSTLSMKDREKLSEKQKERLEKKLEKEVSITQEFEVRNVKSGEAQIKKVQAELIDNIKQNVNSRFESLRSSKPINAMKIVDHTRWDPSDASYGFDDIDILANHFEKPLAYHNFDLASAKMEFIALKRLQVKRYPTIKNKNVFWGKVFSLHMDSFQNILMLIEICLIMPWGQGIVESGFSTVRRIIPEERSSLANKSLNDLLELKLALPIVQSLKENYAEHVVQRAVDRYLAGAKWRWGLKSGVGTNEPDMNVPNVNSDTVSSSEESETESDSDSDLETGLFRLETVFGSEKKY